MNSNSDLSTLSAEQALDLAIAAEEEAQQRYQEFTDQMVLHHTEEAASFFRRMAEFEEQHVERLRSHRLAQFGPAPGTSPPQSPVIEVEAPEYSEVRAFMTLHQAADVALEAERKAYRFYDDLIERVSPADPDLENLFENLRDQERRHEQLIVDYQRTLPAEDSADPEDYVDEPRAL